MTSRRVGDGVHIGAELVGNQESSEALGVICGIDYLSLLAITPCSHDLKCLLC